MGQPLEVHIRKLQEFYWSEADPEGRGFVPLADALRKAGEFQEARRVLRDGLRRHPGFLAGHVVSAWLSLDEGRLDQAESHFLDAVKLDGRNVAALRGLSEIHLERGEEAQALDYLELLLEEDPVDLDLPKRLTELKTRADAATEAGDGTQTQPTLWEDPNEVAEELDFQEATLQPDSSSPPPIQEHFEAPAEPEPISLVVEDGEPMPEAGDLEDALITSTLGEIYLRQGLLGRAEWVFESLLKDDPENPHLRHRLDEVRGLLVNQTMKPADAEASQDQEEDGGELASHGSVAAKPVKEWVPEVIPAVEEPPPESLHIVPIESLAPDRISVEELPPLEIEELPPLEVEERLPLDVEELPPLETVPVGEMTFQEAPSIDGLAPDDLISVDALAPDDIISIDALAPDDFISIDALAPDDFISIDALAPDDFISIDALAPDDFISIDALAPDEPVAIHALAPQGPVPIESLAPDESADGDPAVQDFERWLDKLQ